MTTSTASQILFIDSRVTNADSLLASIDSNIEIVWLSADRDGLEQIADALAGRSGISAVHLVSHGGPGYLSLGAGIVDTASLASHVAQMDTIRAALADTADFLLYGCNVAEGEAGGGLHRCPGGRHRGRRGGVDRRDRRGRARRRLGSGGGHRLH